MTQASEFIDSSGLPWRPTPCAGVSWKKLYFDPPSGESAVLLRFEAGARYDTHRHPLGEQYLVLEGAVEDGGRSYGAMTYVRHAAESVHRPSSEAGCVLFVVLRKAIEVV